MATGFSSADIRQVAVEHWPDGFTGQGGEDAFVVLLDELVGLGFCIQPEAESTISAAPTSCFF